MQPSFTKQRNRLREDFPLCLAHDALLKRLGGVIRCDGNRLLQDNRAAIHNLGDKMYGRTRNFDAFFERRFVHMQTIKPLSAERRDERRMNVAVALPDHALQNESGSTVINPASTTSPAPS